MLRENKMKFTLNAYSELVKLIKDKGYNICNYNECIQYDKFVILRHDVDFEPEKAVEMAETELDLGVKSIYFFLISSDFYNVLSARNQRCIKRILECGHEIGLHFDETKYKECGLEELRTAIFEEIRMLEAMTGVRIKAVSMHRPSKLILESDLKLGMITNTYGKEMFKEIKYLSDARMNWREDVCKIIREEEFDKIQLLTHAFWYENEETVIEERLKRFVMQAKDERYEELKDNLRDLESVLKKEDI